MERNSRSRRYIASWSRYFSFSSFFLFSKVSVTFTAFIRIAWPRLQGAVSPFVPLSACGVWQPPGSVPSRAATSWGGSPAPPGTHGTCSTSELGLLKQQGLSEHGEAMPTGCRLLTATGYDEPPNGAFTAVGWCSANPEAVLCGWPSLTTSGPVRAFAWATALLERTDSLSGTAELPLSSLRLANEGLAEQSEDAVTTSQFGNGSLSSLLFLVSSSSLDITPTVSAIYCMSYRKFLWTKWKQEDFIFTYAHTEAQCRVTFEERTSLIFKQWTYYFSNKAQPLGHFRPFLVICIRCSSRHNINPIIIKMIYCTINILKSLKASDLSLQHWLR